MRLNRWHVSTGIIEVSYPDSMTDVDVQDFKDAMAITFRILERIATNGQPAKPETTSEAKLSNLVPDRNSSSGFRVA